MRDRGGVAKMEQRGGGGRVGRIYANGEKRERGRKRWGGVLGGEGGRGKGGKREDGEKVGKKEVEEEQIKGGGRGERGM